MRLLDVLAIPDTRVPVDASKWFEMRDSSETFELLLTKRQLSSLKAIELKQDELADVVSLKADLNRIKSVDGIEYLSNAMYIDLSLNQIKQIDESSFMPLASLHTLILSSNRIEKTTWIPDTLEYLTKLDLSHNRIRELRHFDRLANLKNLNLLGNEVETLDGSGIQTLSLLKTLNLTSNKVTNIDCLLCTTENEVSVSCIKTLLLAANNIADLSHVAKVVFALENLTDLTLYDNPVAKESNYRFRILQNKRIVNLDHAAIRSSLRDRLAELASKQALDSLVETTTSEYTKQVQTQKTILDQGLNFYKSRQDMMLSAFSTYKKEMEGELDDCIAYADGLTQHRETYLLTSSGLGDWKSRVTDAVAARTEEEARRVALEAKLRRNEIQDKAKRLTYHQKLTELSLKKPRVWMEMKRREAEYAATEEEALNAVLKAKSDRMSETRRTLQEERSARTAAVLKLASSLELENSPEWSDKLEAIRSGKAVATGARRNAAVILPKPVKPTGSSSGMSAGAAASLIQAAFRTKKGFDLPGNQLSDLPASSELDSSAMQHVLLKKRNSVLKKTNVAEQMFNE